MGCCERTCRSYSEILGGIKNEFFWEKIQKLKLSEFKNILEEGRSIPLQIDEMVKLEELNRKIEEWQIRAKYYLENNSQIGLLIEAYKLNKNGPQV